MSSEFDAIRKMNRHELATSVAGTDILQILDVSSNQLKRVTVDDFIDATGVEIELGDDERLYFGDNKNIELLENTGSLQIINNNAVGDIDFQLGDDSGDNSVKFLNSLSESLLDISSDGHSQYLSRRQGRIGAFDVKNYARQPGDVVSITSDGAGLATVTTAVPHYLVTGDNITGYGATQTEYNVTSDVTVLTATTFTYTISGTPATPATTVADIYYVDNAVGYAQVIHDYTDSNASFRIDKDGKGSIVQLVNANNDTFRPDRPAGYVGEADYIQLHTSTGVWFRIYANKEFMQSVDTYKLSNSKADDATSAFQFRAYNDHALHTDWFNSKGSVMSLLDTKVDIGTIASVTSSGTTCKVTTSSAHFLASGNVVTIAGAVETAYNGSFFIAVTGATTFTYTALATPSASPATGTVVGESGKCELNSGIRLGKGFEIQTQTGDITLTPENFLVFNNIPSASTGLPSGAVWANSNVLTIV